MSIDVLKASLADRYRSVREMARGACPHILPLFDSGTADSFLFYVMPFTDGETLRAKLDREYPAGRRGGAADRRTRWPTPWIMPTSRG